MSTVYFSSDGDLPHPRVARVKPTNEEVGFSDVSVVGFVEVKNARFEHQLSASS